MVNIDPLIELVGFLHDKNPQVRAVAAQELVPYSTKKQSLFKSDAFRPITDLRILILDDPKIARDSLTILINLSQDVLIRSKLLDSLFLSHLLSLILSKESGLADLGCMLLSNLAKSDQIESLLTFTRPSTIPTCKSTNVMNQLLDVFVTGANKLFNAYANYDHLSNLFSDLTRFKKAREFFTTVQDYDTLYPLSKVIVFLSPECSEIRRLGTASLLKNCCFETPRHAELLNEQGLNILQCILSPLCNAATQEHFRDEEMNGLFESLQFLTNDHVHEPSPQIILVLLDTLLLLCATKSGREQLRSRQTYPIIRELHKSLSSDDDDEKVDGEEGEGKEQRRQGDDEIGEACDKLVNMLMRDEHPDVQDIDLERMTELHLSSTPAQNGVIKEEGGEGDDEDEEDGIAEV